MDIISHGLWGGIAFGRRRHFAIAFLFGMLPDLIAFGPFSIYAQLNGIHFHRQPPLELIPSWVFGLYNSGHSLLVALPAYFIVRRVSKGVSLCCLAWPLHILFDIPTHSAGYFPTKFLYPVSDFFINGRSWVSPVVWYPNVIMLIILYSIFIFSLVSKRRKQKRLTAAIHPEHMK